MTERTMQEIEDLTKDFADARDALLKEMEMLETAIKRLRDSRMQEIRRLVGEARNAHALLDAAVVDSKSLFTRPKTRVMHGVKVGFQKQPGQVLFADADQVVKLIRKHFADQADTLIKVTETPVKKALSQLTAAELKKIGVTVQETGDRVVIKPADSDIGKIVDALLADEGDTDVKAVA